MPGTSVIAFFGPGVCGSVCANAGDGERQRDEQPTRAVWSRMVFSSYRRCRHADGKVSQ